MKPTSNLKKFLLPVVVLVLIIVAILVAWKGKTLNDQQASIYNTTQFACQMNIGPNGLPLPGTPKLHVNSPNGGEVFTPNQAINLTWSKCFIPTTAHIEVMIAHSNVAQPQAPYYGTAVGIGNAQSTWILNDGQETVVLPNAGGFTNLANSNGGGGLVYGNYYKIWIKATDATTGAVLAEDWSDNWFTVNTNPVTITPSAVSSGQISTPTAGTNNDTGTFITKFTIKATGGDVYIPTVANKAVGYRVQNQSWTPGNPGITQGVTSTLAITGTYPVTPNGNYKIPSGTTAAFTLTTNVVLPAAGGAGQYHTIVTSMSGSKTDVTTPTHTYFVSGTVYSTGNLNLN